MQTSMLTVKVLHEFDSSSYGVDGADLKKIALCDDGLEYAMKRVEDHPLLPITEWVCYSLFRACGIDVPVHSILSRDGLSPAFGSRWILGAAQVHSNPGAYLISNFFGSFKKELSEIYPMDAFLPNEDRHGRNMLISTGLVSSKLLAFDFSRSWLISGQPFGDTNCLNGSQTEKWWQFFNKHMQVSGNYIPLDKIISTLDDDWMGLTLSLAPREWVSTIDINAIKEFWKSDRVNRVSFAKKWTS